MATPPPPPPVPGPPQKAPLPAPKPAMPNQPAPLDVKDVPPEGEHDPNAIQLTFFQQPWVQTLLPFLTSLTLHAAIIIVVVVVALSVQKIAESRKATHEEQIVIPEAAMAPEMAGGVENPGIGGDPTRPAAQDNYEENT